MAREVVVEGDRNRETLAAPSHTCRPEELRRHDQAVAGREMLNLGREELRPQCRHELPPRVAWGIADTVIDDRGTEAGVGEAGDATEEICKRQAKRAEKESPAARPARLTDLFSERAQ